MENEKINGLIENATGNLAQIVDVDTVIGKPITTVSGFQIIPFSKVTLGTVAGGGEYGDEENFAL